MAYDVRNDKLVMFGGDMTAGDIWTYDPGSNDWTDHPSAVPPARARASMAVDSARGEALLFGGVDASNGFFNDTWALNLSSGKWKNMDPPDAPPAGGGYCMAYDSARDEFVLFENGTWVYDLGKNDWTSMNPSPSPLARTGSAMAYDSEHDRMILFGGNINSCQVSDTWSYDLNNNTWTDLNPPDPPMAREQFSFAYDVARGVFILFGGGEYDNDGRLIPSNDTWEYHLPTNRWIPMNPGVSPPARWGHAMVHDATRNVTVLFGGTDGNNDFGDTWIYELDNNSWCDAGPITTPPSRDGHNMVFDSVHGDVLLFGGYWLGNTQCPLNDIWTFGRRTYNSTGVFISDDHWANDKVFFGTLSWDADVPANTSLRFQLRMTRFGEPIDKKDFLGPDGTNSTYYDTSGQQITSVSYGCYEFQYKAYLGTNDTSITPVVRSVTLEYNVLQSIMMLAPEGGENWTGTQDIVWYAHDWDNDPLLFDIFLENDTFAIPLVKDLPNGTSRWSWNTTGMLDGIYRILILAHDDNLFIPLSVDVTSKDFSIYHPPPPNHPPHVTLISPANNSYLTTNSARLQWKGTDIDGDSLTYTVYYSDRPLSDKNILTNITTAEYLNLAGLSNNSTYYWTVDATDGKANGTDVPTEIWSFTLKLPPANIPVRITSTPPILAWVGKEYAYNITSIDEDGDIPIFSIVSGPPNMTLNSSTGELRWVPVASDVGNHTITVQVSDGRGSIDHQTFTITVKETPLPPSPEKPRCIMTNPTGGARLRGLILVHGQAFKGSLPLILVQVRIDNGSWMAASGLDNWSLVIDLNRSSNGNHRIEARAFDGSLYSETVSVEIQVDHPGTTISLEGNPLWLPAIIIAVVAGLGILLVLRRKKMGLK